MKTTIDNWHKSFSLLKDVVSGMGEPEEGDYIYRIANPIFECGFCGYLTENVEWETYMERALFLFSQESTIKDCETRKEYPHNLARICVGSYLGSWLMGRNPSAELLTGSTELYNQGLSKNPILKLTMNCLLSKDYDQLVVLNEELSKQKVNGEVNLWANWSKIFLNPKDFPDKFDAFWGFYRTYAKTIKDPSQESGLFYLAAAKISIETFGLAGDKLSIIQRLAIEPWESKK